MKLDVHPSKDGVIVMSHDPSFSRMIDFKHFDPEFAERVLVEFAKAGFETRRIIVAT